jgi:serine/threonine protein kinase
MFTSGQRIGAYTLIKKLGKGGFGEVWLAERQSQFFTKKVAIKLPHDEQVDFETVKREAQLWEEASGHPNVLPIIDADIYDGQVVIVSEYADGGSLADKLKENGKLSLAEAVEITIGILNGLDFLHQRKIIHRDIKPQNILLQGDTPRLADFGISRAMNTSTISSVVVGTDAYMAPESFDGKRSIQTDIWSVGVVLYQLLKGSLPFPQEHPSERMFAVLTKEFEPMPAEIPTDVQRIIQRALSKTPENRFQTAGEMRSILQKVLLNIAHPTYAPTEVFTNPIATEPAPETVVKPTETGEQDKPAANETAPYYYIPPTEPAFEQPSTGEKQPYTTPVNPEPPPAQFQQFAEAANNQRPKTFSSMMLVLGVLVGVVFFGIIAIIAINSGTKSRGSTGFSTPAASPASAGNVIAATPTATRAATPTPNTNSSPGSNDSPILYCLNNDSGSSVNLRSDCDIEDCDMDASTVLDNYPNGTKVRMAKGSNEVRSKTKSFSWRKVEVESDGQIGWVAGSKLTFCNGK